MRLLYNLDKPNAATRVIDSNDAMDAIVERLREESRRQKEQQAQEIARTEDEKGFTEGLVFAPLNPEDEGTEDGALGDENASGDEALAKVPGVDYDAIAKDKADKIVDAAQSKAADILTNAKAEAEKECEAIKQAAHDEGFSKGVADGKAQMDAMIAENESKFTQRLNELEAEYAAKADTLEADITGAVISVFEKVFGLELEGSEDVLLHLVKGTMHEADNSKEFHIRVARDDVDAVREHLDEFKACVGSDCIVEVLSDHSLAKGQCLIETESGVYDCGPRLQLDNLFRNLKALAG